MTIHHLNINPKVNVILRVFPDGDIIALFPDNKHNKFGLIECYTLSTGAGLANSILIKDLEVPSRYQCKRMIEDLELLGYNIRVVETW